MLLHGKRPQNKNENGRTITKQQKRKLASKNVSNQLITDQVGIAAVTKAPNQLNLNQHQRDTHAAVSVFITIDWSDHKKKCVANWPYHEFNVRLMRERNSPPSNRTREINEKWAPAAADNIENNNDEACINRLNLCIMIVHHQVAASIVYCTNEFKSEANPTIFQLRDASPGSESHTIDVIQTAANAIRYSAKRFECERIKLAKTQYKLVSFLILHFDKININKKSKKYERALDAKMLHVLRARAPLDSRVCHFLMPPFRQ